MKSVKHLLLLCSILLGGLVLTSCEKDDDQPSPQPNVPDSFVFSDIQPNMEIRYERYEQVCGWGNDLSFSGDTLILKTLLSGGQLYFEESFSPFSTNLAMTDPVTYPVTKKNQYILMPERESSSLFYFFGNDTIWTNPTHDIDLFQVGCLLNHENGDQFVGNEIGKLADFHIGAITLENQMAVSCVPIFFELSAYLIYDSQSLHASQAMNDTTFSLQGFVLIDE